VKRRQIIVFAVLAVGLAVFGFLGWYFLVWPVSQKISAAQEERNATQEKLESAKQKALQHEKFQVEAENIRKNLAFVRNRLKGTKHTTDVYRIFSSLAGTYALKDFEMKCDARGLAKGKGLSNLDEIPVLLKFKSGYHHIGHLINSAAEQNVIIIPDELKLNTSDLTGRLPALSAEIKVKVICEREEKK
jgi:Tfp pilus assembly protein PilO